VADAPRIDTLRKQLGTARSLLDDAAGAIETLYSLAYERSPAPRDGAVTRTHPEGYDLLVGDRRARAAYQTLAREVFAASAQISGASRRALRLLEQGDERGDNRRSAQTITAVEHLEALEVQGRRTARGEFDPGRAMAQPTRAGTEKSAAGKIRRLEAELKRTQREHAREVRRLEAQVRRQVRAIEVRDARLHELEVGEPAEV
jgi:hypothetical protein